MLNRTKNASPDDSDDRSIGRLIAYAAMLADPNANNSECPVRWNTAQNAMPASLDELAIRRIRRSLSAMSDKSPACRIEQAPHSTYAQGVDGEFFIDMNVVAMRLPVTDPQAASAVMFLDECGPAFGIAGWHVLEVFDCQHVVDTARFKFYANTAEGKKTVEVISRDRTVLRVRVTA